MDTKGKTKSVFRACNSTAVATVMLAAGVLNALSLAGCGKSGGIQGTYETKDNGLFEPERIIVSEKIAEAGSGRTLITYQWSQEGDTLILKKDNETRRLKHTGSTLEENGKTYEKK